MIVDLAVVLQQDQGKVAAPLALSHTRLQSTLHLAYERVYLMMVLLLNEAAGVGENCL